MCSLTKPDNKVLLLFFIPYLGQYSLQIKTRLNGIIKQCYPNIQLKAIFRSPKCIESLFPFKDSFYAFICHLHVPVSWLPCLVILKNIT